VSDGREVSSIIDFDTMRAQLRNMTIQNPVRAGLIAPEDKWPYVLTAADLNLPLGSGD